MSRRSERSGRAVVAAVSNIFGAGMGLALLGRERAAYGWLAGAWLALFAGVLWPWLVRVSIAVALASAAAALWTGLRTDAPLRWQQRAPTVVLFATLFLAVVTKSYVFESFRMPSSSMHPTIEVGDRFMIDKLSPHFGGYHRGDVIVHVYPCDAQRDYIKRIIGLPVDTEVFVLGDNRNNSNDSRVWGGVPMSAIKGRVTLVWWSRHGSQIGPVH